MTKVKENENLLKARAISKFNIISPFKVRKVVNKLRGMNYEKAMAIMSILPNKGAKIVEKTLKSAFYNLDTKYGNIDPQKVYVQEVLASPGPVLKRIKPRARGRADRIRKRTTHLTVVVSTEKNTGDKK
jgi:large subunit ribosomal protein L22